MLAFFADHIDDVVDGDAAEQLHVLIHHRCGYEVVRLEQSGDIVVFHARLDDVDVLLHDFTDGLFRIAGEQHRQRENANIDVVACGHDQIIGMARQAAEQSEVTLYDIQCDLGADRDGVGIHDAAGAVFRIRQYGSESVTMLRVQRGQYLSGDLVR